MATLKRLKQIPVSDIVRKYLKKHGFDGLAGDDCGCTLDDLMCCGEACSECRPGVKFRAMHEGEMSEIIAADPDKWRAENG